MWTKFKLKRGRVIGLSLVLIPLLSLAVYAYKGTLLGAETSPDGQYIVKYYRSINPFLFRWVPGTPGNSPCKATWVRLYNEYGDKLKEHFANDCHLMSSTQWYDDEVFLPDLTIWKLPYPVTKNTPISHEP